jgi:hypothetical protein
MGLEGMTARMSNYGKSLLLDDKIRSIEETVDFIDRVSQESVSRVIDTVLDRSKLNVALCGEVKESMADIEAVFDF